MRGRTRRIAWAAVGVVALGAITLGTKVVPSDDPLVQGVADFDAAAFGADNFASVRDGVISSAVDAPELAAALADDPEAARADHAVDSSGGPVFSVTLVGVLGEAQSGITPITVEGVPADLVIRVRTGPAINGTELRDATGEIRFGQFTNQIDYQDAASALNDEMKRHVLAPLEGSAVTGATVAVTGAFTLIDTGSWLITPVEMELR